MQINKNTQKLFIALLTSIFLFSCSACSQGVPTISDPENSSVNEETISDTVDETTMESKDITAESTETTTESIATTTVPTKAAPQTKKHTTTTKETKATTATTTVQSNAYQIYHNAYNKLKMLKSIDMDLICYTHDIDESFPGFIYSHNKKQIIDESNPAMYDKEYNNDYLSHDFKEYCYLNGMGYTFDYEGGSGDKLEFDEFVKEAQVLLPLSNEYTTEGLVDTDFSNASITKANDGAITIKLNISQKRAQKICKMVTFTKYKLFINLADMSISKADYTIEITPNGYLKTLIGEFTRDEEVIRLETRYNNPGEPVSIDFVYANYPK